MSVSETYESIDMGFRRIAEAVARARSVAGYAIPGHFVLDVGFN
jgi:hypothetical protein